MKRREMTPAFWRVANDTGCWLWTQYIDVAGYARIGRRYIHRETYLSEHGEIPIGLEIDHLCRRRACVNPEHLRAVTHAENMANSSSGWRMRVRTCCPQGHPYSTDNTIIKTKRGKPYRKCRTCFNAGERAREARKRQTA